MQSIIEIIFKTIVLTTFSFIGAFYRWLFFLGKKPYGYLKNDNPYFNGSLGVFISGMFVLFIRYCILNKK